MLLIECSCGDVAAVRARLLKGTKVNFTDEDGHSPMSLAIDLRSQELTVVILRLLLSHGGDPNLTHIHLEDEEYCSPIELAMENGLLRVVQLLLMAGSLPKRAAEVRGYRLIDCADEGGFRNQVC